MENNNPNIPKNKKQYVDVTKEQIDVALEIIQQVRTLASKNSRYGFSDDFDTFIMKMMCLTPQSYGARLQKFLIERFGFDTIQAKDDAGDLRDQTGEHWELKVSIITPTNEALNLVQIRPWQDIYGYYCIAIDTRVSPYEEIIFALTKKQMNDEIKKMGATAAHGTKKAIKKNENIELRLSILIKESDAHYKRWLENYLKKKMKLDKNKK